jgi:hypothetical protein
VSDTGPTFWFGGTVDDPDSLFGQAFLEVQFYPNAMVKKCTPNGGFHYTYAPGVYTVCSPVWAIVGNSEPAAFNGMLSTATDPDKPMVMQAGDTVTIHYYGTKANDGAHITVSDINTGEQGTIILNSPTSGPLNPTFNRQKIGNSLGWGIVHDAPNSFVWEIGHESLFANHPDRFCAPGNTKCDSYDKAAWAGTMPIHILGVSFGDNGPAKRWAVVSDYGGKAEVTDPHETGSTCTRYGGPFCIYPWFTRNGDGSLTYGVNYPTTVADYGRAAQFQQTTACGGPFGARTTYCMTRIG